MAKTREQIMKELHELELKINSLVAKMPAPTVTIGHPFPTKIWILAAVFIALYLADEGTIPIPLPEQIAGYGTAYVVFGAIFGVWAGFASLQSLFSGGKGSGGKYMKQSQEVEKLNRDKKGLQAQLKDTPE